MVKHLVMICADADRHLFSGLYSDHYIDLYMTIKHLVMICADADKYFRFNKEFIIFKKRRF